jgi:hypothetical protein
MTNSFKKLQRELIARVTDMHYLLKSLTSAASFAGVLQSAPPSAVFSAGSSARRL